MDETALPGSWIETDAGHELDLRGLDPPEPMVAILGRIEAAPGRAAFVVRLPREPLHLYGELAARGWGWERLPADPGEVRLRLAPS